MAKKQRSATPEEDEEPAYEVEKIVAHRLAETEDGLAFYEFKIRWKGYKPDEDTWEPRESLLDGAEAVLDAYIAKRESKGEQFYTEGSRMKDVRKLQRKSEAAAAAAAAAAANAADSDDEEQREKEKEKERKRKKRESQAAAVAAQEEAAAREAEEEKQRKDAERDKKRQKRLAAARQEAEEAEAAAAADAEAEKERKAAKLVRKEKPSSKRQDETNGDTGSSKKKRAVQQEDEEEDETPAQVDDDDITNVTAQVATGKKALYEEKRIDEDTMALVSKQLDKRRNQSPSPGGDADVPEGVRGSDAHASKASWEKLVKIESLEQDDDGSYRWYITWEDSSVEPNEWLLNDTARTKFPQKLLDFYQEHLKFKSGPEAAAPAEADGEDNAMDED